MRASVVTDRSSSAAQSHRSVQCVTRRRRRVMTFVMHFAIRHRSFNSRSSFHMTGIRTRSRFCVSRTRRRITTTARSVMDREPRHSKPRRLITDRVLTVIGSRRNQSPPTAMAVTNSPARRTRRPSRCGSLRSLYTKVVARRSNTSRSARRVISTSQKRRHCAG